eukprot:scaffold20782_cov55-Cyclotella_meneghiniana.AAC.2
MVHGRKRTSLIDEVFQIGNDNVRGECRAEDQRSVCSNISLEIYSVDMLPISRGLFLGRAISIQADQPKTQETRTPQELASDDVMLQSGISLSKLVSPRGFRPGLAELTVELIIAHAWALDRHRGGVE